MDFPQPLDRTKLVEEPKPSPKKETAPRPTGARKAPLEARLQEAIGGIGIGVALINEIDGIAIIQGSERLAKALDKAARQNPSVRRTLEAVLTGSVWAEVSFAVGAITIPIALNHRLLPESLMLAIPGMGMETNDNSGNGTQPTV